MVERNEILPELGSMLKKARIQKGISRDQLSKDTLISSRYLIAIENEGRKPSLDVLYRLIRVLNISADLIFYPTSYQKDTELEQMILNLRQCNEKQQRVFMALFYALIKTLE